jgi:hypothetical protein
MAYLRLAVALGLALDFSGALHVYGMHDALGSTREHIMATLLLLIAGLWLVVKPAPSSDHRETDVHWVAWLAPLAFVLSISDIFSFVDEGWSLTRALVFGGGTLALCFAALRRAPATVVAALSLALGIGLRSIHIKYIPIDPSLGDMLPLVQGALDNVLAGRSPYTMYQMPWELPLTYLPLTWLAYAPAYLTGIDIRWTNVVAELLVGGAAVFVGSRLQGGRSDAPLLMWAWLFLSPSIIHWDMVTSAPIGWAALAWMLALVVTRQHFAPVALGVTAGTTPFVAVFAPFVALLWVYERGWTTLLRRGLIAAAVAGVLILPWFVWSPDQFLEGNVRWFNDLNRFPGEKWAEEETWVQITGFAGEFWRRGWETWLKPIQAALVLLVAAVYAARRAPRAALLPHTVAAFILFMLFNPVLWPYLYNPALVAAMLATALPSSVPIQSSRTSA